MYRWYVLAAAHFIARVRASPHSLLLTLHAWRSVGARACTARRLAAAQP